MSFLVDQGVKYVFAVTGGASLHMIHSVADNSNIDYVCPHHEQAAAMAADGYARVSGELGVAMATSGPGATNLITGICCSYYDSIPTLYLSGQVSTFRMTGDTGVRQIGFQETPIVGMCQHITKYAVQITDANNIRYELEKAIYIAKSNRPGPVLIDIPDNLQRQMIDINTLKPYQPPLKSTHKSQNKTAIYGRLLKLIKASKRPIIIAGWALHLSHMEDQLINFAEGLNIPIAMTWGAADIIPHSHPLYIGTFGTHGMRHANFTVQNADLVISLGSRLDTKSTGSPINTFARDAKKVVIDIDLNELNKFAIFGMHVDELIEEDLRVFFTHFSDLELNANTDTYTDWFDSIASWKTSFASFDQHKILPNDKINPYVFLDFLSSKLSTKAKIFIDTGCAIAWSMQSLKLRDQQRTYHDFNNTAMGWALPAAIGGYFADKTNAAHLNCIIGDGAFMMTSYELATIKFHKIPIRVFIMNNAGYSMIQQTEDQWLESDYQASSNKSGLAFPDFEKLASAYDFNYLEINTQNEMKDQLDKLQILEGTTLINVVIPSSFRVTPQVKFGRPNEDMEPLLPRDLFVKSMIIGPIPIKE